MKYRQAMRIKLHYAWIIIAITFLYSKAGSYSLSFYFSIIILSMAAILCGLLPEPHKVKQESAKEAADL